MDAKETAEAQTNIPDEPGATLQGTVDPVETTIVHNNTQTIHGHTMLAVIIMGNKHKVSSDDFCRFDNMLVLS